MARYWSFSFRRGIALANPSDDRKQGPAPEEISQTLMTNRKPGDRESYHIHANNIKLGYIRFAKNKLLFL
jgi:hypothetical protein